MSQTHFESQRLSCIKSYHEQLEQQLLLQQSLLNTGSTTVCYHTLAKFRDSAEKYQPEFEYRRDKEHWQRSLLRTLSALIAVLASTCQLTSGIL